VLAAGAATARRRVPPRQLYQSPGLCTYAATSRWRTVVTAANAFRHALAAMISTSTRISGQTSCGITSSIEAGRTCPRKRERTFA
jgi:hypothetical protein